MGSLTTSIMIEITGRSFFRQSGSVRNDMMPSQMPHGYSSFESWMSGFPAASSFSQHVPRHWLRIATETSGSSIGLLKMFQGIVFLSSDTDSTASRSCGTLEIAGTCLSYHGRRAMGGASFADFSESLNRTYASHMRTRGGTDVAKLRGAHGYRTICEVFREINDMHQGNSPVDRKTRKLLVECENMVKRMSRRLY